jgi:hypothetical protein
MNERWAEENLQVIRTLMERTAVYRRALAPVMVMAGSVGTVAAVGGIFWRPPFVVYWTCVAVVVMAAGFFLTRRQALKDGEAFWSPPARRVAQALMPGLVVAAALTVVARLANLVEEQNLTLIWVMLYGCALHAAGFFAPRRLRVLGWVFIAGGVILLVLVGVLKLRLPVRCAHATMGAFFGVLHLAVGVYLYATDKGSNDL